MRSPFLERLAGGPILCDGAMGTQLYARGVSYERCFDELNLTDPSLVQAVHRDYIGAGAEIIETNTFGANRVRLAAHGLEGRVHDINLRAVKIAREAREIAGQQVFVAGSVGPIGRPLEPVGRISLADVREVFQEQIEGLLEGGVDLVLLETFGDLREILEALAAARRVCDLPVVAQMTFADDGRTLSGHGPEDVVRALEAGGADVVGVNCSVGPQGALEVMERMALAAGIPLSAQPNAGLPSLVEGRFLYFSTPPYFADYALRLVRAGATMVGGCCGTTPRHIQAMHEALRELRPRVQSGPVVAPVLPATAEEFVPDPAAPPTSLARKLRAGEFVISVEMSPPRGINPAKLLENAAMLRDLGIDAVNLTDNAMARVRMSCLASAFLIQERVGVETIIHFTTRDRNLMALQSDLIGAHALGVRNVLALTGDPPRLGDYPNATGIWDVDSIGLVRILRTLNEGNDWHGTSIGKPAAFFVGCAANPTAEDPALELDRLHRKLEAGADFIMTQPVFDPELLDRFLGSLGRVSVPVLLGVMPLQSYRHAEYMHNEVPGIVIPGAVLERMRAAGEQGVEAGLEMAQDFLRQTKRLVAGIYLMPSFGRFEVVGQLVRVIRG